MAEAGIVLTAGSATRGAAAANAATNSAIASRAHDVITKEEQKNQEENLEY